MATFVLPDLPYPKDALAPHMSAETFDFHHGKHHQKYVDTGNDLVAGTAYEGKPIEEIIVASFKKPDEQAIFNNAAQVWNHTFFWNCMGPNGGGKPSGDIADRIDRDFGSYEKFAEEFKKQGVGQFGSGWVWLVDEGDKLSIMKTPNAENPMAHGKKALLTADVWEHAYYLDYQNRRPDFLSAYLDHLVNWDFVNQTMKG